MKWYNITFILINYYIYVALWFKLYVSVAVGGWRLSVALNGRIVMTTKNVLKTIAISSTLGLVLLASSDDVLAAKKVKWKMQSAWGTQVPNAGESGAALSSPIVFSQIK